MATLVAGKLAPGFTLPTTDGKKVNLHDLLRSGPVVLAFFKVSCPVCQFAFPLYQRMAKAHPRAGVTFLGICQNPPADARAFAREYGVTFAIAIDNDTNHYAVSNAYGLTNVPTLFYIAADGEIEVSSVGWVKAEVEEVNGKLAALHQQKPPQLWHTAEDVPEFRPG